MAIIPEESVSYWYDEEPRPAPLFMAGGTSMTMTRTPTNLDLQKTKARTLEAVKLLPDHAKRSSNPRIVRPATRRAAGQSTDLPIHNLSVRLLELSAENDRLKAELAAVEAQRDLNRNLFEGLPVGYALLSENGIIQSSNKRLADMLDAGPRIFPQSFFAQVVAREDRPEFLEHLRRCKAAAGTVSTKLALRKVSGKTFPAELVSSRCEVPDSRERNLICTVVIDLAARQADQARLELSEHRYHALLDTMEGIIWEADGQTLEVKFVSAFAEKLLGYPVKRWSQGRFWEHHIHVDDRERVMQEVTRALAGRTNFSVEYRVLTEDRRILWMHDRVSLRTQQGKPKLFGIAVDVTEHKIRELELKAMSGHLATRVAERTAELQTSVAELETFSYTLSHDLRAPLRAIQGYSELLLTRLGQHAGPREHDFFRRMQNSAARMDALIQDVLRYSRVIRVAVELEPVDVKKVIKGILNDYPNLQPPYAVVDMAEPLTPVIGHEAFLTQCISNLLGNAVKFVAHGQRPRVRVYTEVKNGEVNLCFEDNGIGIPPEDQKRIFGIFQRVHHPQAIEGTGIGLAIVKKAVERMGGRVGVESTPGKGSKFWLRLPAGA